MKTSTFVISKMDCPSEEQIIRMKLAGLEQIRSMDFDIPARMLQVVHSGDEQEILQRLDSLDFGTRLAATVETGDPVTTANGSLQRKLLLQVLAINLFFFVLEIVAGLIAGSMGLVADSLDMLADSLVYGLALFAVGSTVIRQQRVARISGYFQLFLAVLGFIEVIRRFFDAGSLPSFQTMIFVSALALAGNILCLVLLQRSKSKEAHMQASMIFTSNDVIANAGVIVAGAFVYFTASRIPDLIIGTLVFGLVARGAFRILRLAHRK